MSINGDIVDGNNMYFHPADLILASPMTANKAVAAPGGCMVLVLSMMMTKN